MLQDVIIGLYLLIWSMLWLRSYSRESYVSSGWENYTIKCFFPDDVEASNGGGYRNSRWGQYLVLIVPKNRGLSTTAKRDEE